MKLSVGGVLDLYAVWFPVPCPMDMTCMSDRHVRTCKVTSGVHTFGS